MYYYLKGTIEEILEDSIVVDVNGIGYQVLVSNPSDFVLYSVLTLYVYYVVREDEQYLVGFKTKEEKSFFEKLTSVKGIGPRTALGALSGINLDEFVSAIMHDDVKKLKKLPGIGPKAASQIILDMKGTLVQIDAKSSPKILNENMEIAKQALLNLGFKTKEIDDYFKQISDQNLSDKEYITLFLKLLEYMAEV
jgi:Holliday junction DNA helicase RuvA